MASAAAWNDKRFEIIIGRLLRAGVMLAAAWVLAGGIHYLIQFRGEKPDYRAFHGEPADLRYIREIVHEGLELNAPLHLTWSCYQNEDQACGVCDSCALRLRGFQRAGVEDPIPYVIRPEYR